MMSRFRFLKMLSLPLKDDVYSSSFTEKTKTQQRDCLGLMWGKKRGKRK